MTYGDPAPVITPIVSGLQNGENARRARRQPAVHDGAGSTSPVGDYASACGGAVDANYTITYVPW